MSGNHKGCSELITDYLTAILPMRAGSKRVPRKNLLDLEGKPLFSWALGAIQDCPNVDRIVVDSDSEEILNTVSDLFPDVLLRLRPRDLGSDETSMNQVLESALKELEGEWFLQFHATTPFLQKQDITDAVKLVMKNEAAHDSVFGVTEIKARLWDGGGSPVNHEPNRLLPTQDLRPILVENSSFYLFRKTVFEKKKNRIGSNPLLFRTSHLSGIDIDTQEDLDFARLLAKALI